MCSCACFDNETTCKCKTCCCFPTKSQIIATNSHNNTNNNSNSNSKAKRIKPLKKNKITKQDNENKKFFAYFYESSIVKRLGSTTNKARRGSSNTTKNSVNKSNNIEMVANHNNYTNSNSNEIIKINTYGVKSYEF